MPCSKKYSRRLIVLENLLSDYDPSAETCILNEKAQHQWVPVSDRLWDILTECRHYHDLTKGYFDIGSGWHKKALFRNYRFICNRPAPA